MGSLSPFLEIEAKGLRLHAEPAILGWAETSSWNAGEPLPLGQQCFGLGSRNIFSSTTLSTQSSFFWVGLLLVCAMELLGKEVATEGVAKKCFEDPPICLKHFWFSCWKHCSVLITTK